MCMRVRLCVYISIYILLYTTICIHIYVYTQIYICICKCVYIHTHVYVYMYICIYIYIYIYLWISTLVRHTHICVMNCSLLYLRERKEWLSWPGLHLTSKCPPLSNLAAAWGAMGWLRLVGSLNYRSLLQNIVSFVGLFCTWDLWFNRSYKPEPPHTDFMMPMVLPYGNTTQLRLAIFRHVLFPFFLWGRKPDLLQSNTTQKSGKYQNISTYQHTR